MEEYILKSALLAEIERLVNNYDKALDYEDALEDVRDFLNTLEVKDPYEQCIQYPSVKDGIKAHAETYSFNIESLLFNQLTKEQQALWRKEIEQACISGGEVGVELARDQRYKENIEEKEVDLEKEIDDFIAKGWEGIEEDKHLYDMIKNDVSDIAKHFFELGLKVAQKGE